MSLRVWLPLTGDLENKGLNPLKFSGNASVYSNGKIGKCYSFNGVSSYLQSNSTLNISGDAEFSIAFWMYWNSDTWPTDYAGIVSTAVTTSYSGLAVNLKDGKIDLDFWNTRYIQSSVTLTQKTWHHIAVTKIPGKDDASHCHIYIDGNEVAGTGMQQTPNITNAKLLLGVYARTDAAAARHFNGYLNDVRVYDNALSPLEIKELAQGLVLHYPLNKTAGTPTFVNTYPTFDTSSADGGWSHWTSSGTGTFSQNTDKQYIYDKSQTYSHCISYSADGTYKGYLCYQAPAFEGGFRSIQAIIKEENGSPITNSICFPTWNANQSGAATYEQWQIIEPLGNGFYRCVVNGFKQDGSNDLVGIYVKAGYKIYISCFYIEDNVEECTYNCADLRTEIVDVSGYSRNGIPLGTLALSSDTPRYDNALTFNGTNSAIRFKDNGIGNIFNDSWTLSFWIKSNSDLGTRSIYLGGYEQSPYINIEKSNTNKLRFVWNIVVDRQGTKTLADNTWYMITVVASSLSDVKCYINGELDLTITDTRAALTFPDSYLWYIGRDTRENTGLFFHGNMSDFRIYATALSEADIINLYKTSARIDNLGNLHNYEVNELSDFLTNVHGYWDWGIYSNYNYGNGGYNSSSGASTYIVGPGLPTRLYANANTVYLTSPSDSAVLSPLVPTETKKYDVEIRFRAGNLTYQNNYTGFKITIDGTDYFLNDAVNADLITNLDVGQNSNPTYAEYDLSTFAINGNASGGKWQSFRVKFRLIKGEFSAIKVGCSTSSKPGDGLTITASIPDLGVGIRTEGKDGTTNFNLTLTESITQATDYTLMCNVAGMPKDSSWTFLVGGSTNTDLSINLHEGFNICHFTANVFSFGTNRLILSDTSGSRTSTVTFSKFLLKKDSTSQIINNIVDGNVDNVNINVKQSGLVNASQFVEESDKTRFFSGGTAYINEIKEV